MINLQEYWGVPSELWKLFDPEFQKELEQIALEDSDPEDLR